MPLRTQLRLVAALFLLLAGLGMPLCAETPAKPVRVESPEPGQVEDMKVGEDVGFVFAIDLGAVPGSTWVEVEVPGQPAAEQEAPAEARPAAEPAVDEVAADELAETAAETAEVEAEVADDLAEPAEDTPVEEKIATAEDPDAAGELEFVPEDLAAETAAAEGEPIEPAEAAAEEASLAPADAPPTATAEAEAPAAPPSAPASDEPSR